MCARRLTDYYTVTEGPAIKASREQMAMLYTRYRYASGFSVGKDVLEVACGSGMGLGYLAQRARRVVGGDLTESLIGQAQRHYRGRVGLLRFDAHYLPFQERSFDLVVLYEAIYYLSSPKTFLAECRRVLREKGSVLVCTVNKEWSDFNPSPFSTYYFSISELASLLERQGFEVQFHGAFPVDRDSMKAQIISLIKRNAVALHLMPKTMQGKQLLKRIFFGKLFSLPSEIEDGMAEYVPPVLISDKTTNSQYKVFYAIAHMHSLPESG